MPFIDLSLCPHCYGTTRRGEVVSVFDNDGTTAGSIRPCECESGVEAITEDGEVLGVGKRLPPGKLSHHGTQEPQAEHSPDTLPPP